MLHPLIFPYTVPLPTSVKVIPPQDTNFAGYSFNLTCIVSLPPAVDIPVTVNIAWTEPNETTPTPPKPAIMESLTQYSGIADFISVVETDAAEYQCIANVSISSSFVTNRSAMTGTNKVKIGKFI